MVDYQWNGIIELSALPALQSLTLTHDVYYQELLYPAVAAHTDLLRRPPPHHCRKARPSVGRAG